ncbi:hypothetical protein IWX76_001319 [Pedobacter sp. CAN_A7]
MQKHSFKNSEDLILGIKVILSKHRCSFSDEEQVLLNDCINMLEQSRTAQDIQSRMLTSVKVLGTIVRIFSIYDHLKDLF